MERLTYWARKNDSSGEWRVNENGTEYTGPHVDRLAEIENISMREEVSEKFRITKNIPLDRLRELVKNEKD